MTTRQILYAVDWWCTTDRDAAETPEGLIDFEMTTPDSFTVIRLWPDRPPTSKTIYGTVPCTIAGTPTMAISGDGRFGLITNHGCQPESWGPLRYPEDQPLTNADIRPEEMSKQKPAPPRSNRVSTIDLTSPEFRVVDRVLFDDEPTHVLPHSDGEHFVVGASVCFYVRRFQPRMPAIIGPEHYDLWLDPHAHDMSQLQRLLWPYPATEMALVPAP